MIVRFTRVVSIIGVGTLVLAWSARAVSGQADPTASRPLTSVVGKPAASFSGLTALDYIEIKQLASRYAYAVDSGADNGNVYASLFASDGAFADRMGRETKGREALAALARRNTRGPQSAFHFIVNHVIEPTSDGAVGKEYLVQLRMGEAEKPNDIFGGGHYEDVYVKTPDGWRFKRRQFMPSEGSPRPRREPEAR
ncbi:MAG TPA: nuclear transport factor 2 family protein [Vicinamibacterales bacterium]|nr:nuclear transport factor 2 family protein [Vicinamibacterales bacterium]